MNCVKLIIFVFILTKTVTKCQNSEEESEYLSEIVEDINNYRIELMCQRPVIGLGHISKKDKLVETANGIFKNSGNYEHFKGKQITSETCKYNRWSGSFRDIVEDFISQCANNAKGEHNSDASWLWNPSIKEIGCVFNKNHTNFIFCVVNEVDEATYTDIQFEIPELATDKVSNRSDLFTNTCGNNNNIYRRNYHTKSCMLQDVSRHNITRTLNNVRNEIARLGYYTNLKYVKWDYDLEIAAGDVNRLDLLKEVVDCFITKKYGNKTASYRKLIVFNGVLNVYKTAFPNDINNIGVEVLGKISESKLKYDYFHAKYWWMYDAELIAIGCSLSIYSYSSLMVVCLLKSDPKRAFNLKTGSEFCSECLCSNNDHPYLCTADLNSVLSNRTSEKKIKVKLSDGSVSNNVYSTLVFCVLCGWIILVFINIITISIYMRIFLKFNKKPKDDLYEMHTYETINYRSRESLQIN